jgi:outer membrane receptor protein involved in Fe transport
MVPFVTSAAEVVAADSAALEEVIVTAQRRPERTLDVPASVSVITAADIESLHATSLSDLAAAVPGFVIVSGGSPGQATIVLRGFAPSSYGNLVTTLIDDAPAGISSTAEWTGDNGFALDMFPFDIERIEVLRGPQGTLYGPNSMEGLVKYVTRDASLTASEAQVGVEGFGIEGGGSLGVAARGTWSAPLIEGTLGVRASLYDQETPGYIENPVRGLHHENTLSQHGGRLAMLWQPLGDLRIKLQAIYQRTDSGGNAVVFAEQLGTAQDPYYRPGNWLGDLTYPHSVPEPFWSEVKLFSASVQWHMAFVDLVSTTSYSDKGLANVTDISSSLGYVQPILDPNTTSTLTQNRYHARVKKAAQEIRLESPTGRRFGWQAGIYYTNENAAADDYQTALDEELQPIAALKPFFDSSFPATYTETALFGTLTYSITERLELIAGLRWQTDRQDLESHWLPYQSTLPPYQVYPGGKYAIGLTETRSTYAYGARFRLRPETMLYMRVASGDRPGFPNGTVPHYPEIPPYVKPDTMVSYELGVKSELVNRKASLDVDLYKMNWSNAQVDLTTPDGQVQYVANAAGALSEGVEFAATYWPVSALRLAGNAAYMDTYVTQAVPALGIGVGARLPWSPRWTAAAMFDFRMRDLGGWTPQLVGSWRYVAAQYSSPSTLPPVGLVPAYSWTDFAFRLTKNGYELSLYAKNLFDKRAFNNGGPTTNNTTGATYFAGPPIEPRVVGLSATGTF